jgi:hypothetical protein
MVMEEIQSLWDAHQSRPFPKFPRGYVIQGELDDLFIDLVLADGGAAGCISTFIHNRGKLDERRNSILRKCVEDLKTLKDLFGENIPNFKAYIIQLLHLSEKVLAMCE